MKIQTEPIANIDDEMILISLLDGNLEINKELLPSINKTISSLQLSSIQDLEKISEKKFFNVFTPLMNEQLNLL